jgi:5-methylcytosine-specific restriction endonuclease McrA
MSGVYPEDWAEIAARVKESAYWQCENCGHRHDPAAGRCLTVHHLDGDKSNCVHENLVALCQVCHLHIQARFYPGQLMLPGIARPFWMFERGLG